MHHAWSDNYRLNTHCSIANIMLHNYPCLTELYDGVWFTLASTNCPTLFLQFIPDVLYIREDAKKHVLAVHSTVPIPCHGFEYNRRCKVTLALSVHESGVCIIVCESLTNSLVMVSVGNGEQCITFLWFFFTFIYIYILICWLKYSYYYNCFYYYYYLQFRNLNMIYFVFIYLISYFVICTFFILLIVFLYILFIILLLIIYI